MSLQPSARACHGGRDSWQAKMEAAPPIATCFRPRSSNDSGDQYSSIVVAAPSLRQFLRSGPFSAARDTSPLLGSPKIGVSLSGEHVGNHSSRSLSHASRLCCGVSLHPWEHQPSPVSAKPTTGKPLLSPVSSHSIVSEQMQVKACFPVVDRSRRAPVDVCAGTPTVLWHEQTRNSDANEPCRPLALAGTSPVPRSRLRHWIAAAISSGQPPQSQCQSEGSGDEEDNGDPQVSDGDDGAEGSPQLGVKVGHHRISRPTSITSAFTEGVAGAKAMAVDVVLFMGLRTVMNHQYRYGRGTFATIQEMYRAGGIGRFYSGFWFAIIEGPLSRGVGAAANYATLTYMEAHPELNQLPIAVKTAASSLIAASFRLTYYPLDTFKTMLQVEGKGSSRLVFQKIRNHGLGVLYHGVSSAIFSAALKHTLWFTTYNHLEALSVRMGYVGDERTKSGLIRYSLIGATCSIITNVLSNPLSVLKSYKQTTISSVSYAKAVRDVVHEYGIGNLLTRGLYTRLWVDVLNSIVFTVVWRYLVRLKKDSEDDINEDW